MYGKQHQFKKLILIVLWYYIRCTGRFYFDHFFPLLGAYFFSPPACFLSPPYFLSPAFSYLSPYFFLSSFFSFLSPPFLSPFFLSPPFFCWSSCPSCFFLSVYFSTVTSAAASSLIFLIRNMPCFAVTAAAVLGIIVFNCFTWLPTPLLRGWFRIACTTRFRSPFFLKRSSDRV